jgi:hypothetical protein
MRTRGAAIQGGLAGVALIAAWATWQREPDRAPGEVIVVDVGKSDVQTVRYEDDKKWVQMSRRGDEIWMRLSANEQAKTPEREVRGNEGATRLYDKFGPLRATRALGTLAADKLKELGLDAPKKKLIIEAKGGKRTFLVGTSPYNVSDPYVMDEGDKRVYVLGGGIMGDLDSAAVRLVDRNLHGFKQNEFDGVTVAAGGKTRELVQTGREQPTTAKLASKKSPAKPDEMAKNWHDKLWRLYVTDVLGKGENPPAGIPHVLGKVEYFEGGKSKGFVELGRLQPPAPPPPANTTSTAPPPAPPVEVWARTEHTAGWVKLPQNADDVLKEAEKIAAGE